MSSPPPHRRRTACAVLAAFLLLYIPLQVASSNGRSATYDEPVHLAAGYAALVQGDYRFDPTHPPLLRLWAALPLIGRVQHAPDLAPTAGMPLLQWLNGQTYKVGSEFLASNGDPDDLLQPARFMTILTGAALGILVFCWTLEFVGLTPASIAAALFAIEPNLSAHGTLVTTDAGITLFVFATVYFLWRTHRSFSLWNLAGLAASFALAFVSKYSAVCLIPIVGVLLVVAVRNRGAITARRACAVVLLLAGSAYLAIWAVYRFRYAPGPGGSGVIATATAAGLTDHAPFYAGWIALVDRWHLLPNAYAEGLILCDTTAQDITGFLAGKVALGGWWYYFPVAFLIKTTAVLLVLFCSGLALLLQPAANFGLGMRKWILLPIGIYMAFAIASSLNIGVRHILPIYPFAIVFAAAAWRQLHLSQRPAARFLAAAAIAIAPVRVAFTWPHTLTFFNAFVGGSANGHKFLADSNLDWGQGLKSLKQWMDATGVNHINLAYSGTVDPSAYGINCTLLPGSTGYLDIAAPELPGYVGIGRTVQSRVGLTPEWALFYAGFADATPVATIANTIQVYRVDHWPELPLPAAAPTPEQAQAHLDLAENLQYNLGWPKAAIRHYRYYLRRRPNDSRARTDLALALMRAGDTASGMTIFTQLTLDNPNPGRAAASISFLLLRHGFPTEAQEFARYAAAFPASN